MPIAQFSGLASGIDSKSLIDAIIQARQTVNDKRRAEIDHLTSENDALEELNKKFLALNDLIDPFRTVNAGGLSKKSTSSDATVATAIVGSNANNASYSLTVTSVANSATGSFDLTSYTSGSSFVSTAGSGNVTITAGLGGNQVVINAAVVQNSTTVDQLVAAINADPNAAGRVAASAVNVGTSASPDFRIVVSTLRQGTDYGTLALSANPAITELQSPTVEQATDAVFSILGVGTITRSENTIDDVVSGVTFNLLKAGSTVISINDDPDTTSDKIEEFVSAYNDIVSYIAENDKVDQNTDTRDRSIVYGSLAKTRVDNDFLAIFRTNLSSAIATSGTAVQSMAEIGISTNRDGTLEFDAEKFKTAVGNDAVGVGEVLNDFADSVAGVSGSLYQFTKLEGFVDVAQEANGNQIDNINESITRLDRQTDKMRERLTLQFSNLESITGKLQSAQQSLSGILAGLG